jgi:hypothetical protein
MGLDMFLFGVVDDNDEYGARNELAYWRKHPNLHGYIVQAFANGVDECQKIPLTAENLKQIILAVKDKNLPNTTGFFFGQSYGDKEELESDLNKLAEALDWLNNNFDENRAVYYRASW